MATGDKAAAKGLRVVPESKDLKLGYDDINKRGDELADEMDARAAADAALTTAVGTKLNATKFRVTSTPMTAGTATTGDVRVW